jgi:hypothetical protein
MQSCSHAVMQSSFLKAEGVSCDKIKVEMGDQRWIEVPSDTDPHTHTHTTAQVTSARRKLCLILVESLRALVGILAAGSRRFVSALCATQ